MSEHSDRYPRGEGPTLVFVYSSRAVDEALDTTTVVERDGLIYVPEIKLMEAIGRPGADPNFNPASAWKIIRQSDQQTVFVFGAPG